MKARWIGISAVALIIVAAGHVRPARAKTGEAQATEALARRIGCLKCHGLEKSIIGPAFHDIAARYADQDRDYDVSFMSVAARRDIPQHRKSLVIVARIGNDVHIRSFDANGKIIVDKAVSQLPDSPEWAERKLRLKGDGILNGAVLSREERQKIVANALSIAGNSTERARDALSEKIKKGGKGNWTSISRGVPMPPFSKRLSDAEIERLVDWVLRPAGAVELKVMKMGLGSGTVTSSSAGISCGNDCDETYESAETVTLTAVPDAGSTFARWEGDGAGASNPCSLLMDADRSARAVFNLAPVIPELGNFTPEGIQTYLTANPAVNSAARFIFALPAKYKQNWILMSRSESLQTGTAEYPRLLLPSPDAQFVFTAALATHSSYPGSHPNAIEYMQWDAAERNFRFHEIVLADIPEMGDVTTDPDGTTSPTFPARRRGISIDDSKCSKCHSTQNVLNRSTDPGTTGLPPGTIKAKNKPNWDAYDSWGGMMPLNRDRIYQGSVEAAAFRKMFNPWTWRMNDAVRKILEQLELQPPDQFLPDGNLGEANSVPREDVITRTSGGTHDGHVNFAFDASPPVLTEPVPTGTEPSITTSYSFDGAEGSGVETSVTRGGSFVTLHHSDSPTSDEGRGVQLFDLLGGLDGQLNAIRIADELINHRIATGSVPIDIRPIALAITKGKIVVNSGANSVESTVPMSPLTVNFAFFDARNGLRINDLVDDTRKRTESVPRRKADIEKLNLDRTGDIYLSNTTVGVANGLIPQFGATTSAGTDTSMTRIRQEVFRRPIDLGAGDSTVMKGIYVDRESYIPNTDLVAVYRYFLEPLGVSVDKWSMGVRGRSRTYSFADVFGNYLNEIQGELTDSLRAEPVPGLSDPDDDVQLIAAVNSTLSFLPPVEALPPYTDVQRIFNKSCIECHGGLNYPPYRNYVSNPESGLDLSENESPAAGDSRLGRSYRWATAFITPDPARSYLYERIIDTSENCPYGLMPCGGPALSKVNVETIRRWIIGGSPSTDGDPHIKTVDGIRYDFQAAGEFVFLRGENLELQVRQTAVETDAPRGPDPHTGLTSCISVNGAVAIRIGKNRITYQPNLSGKPDPNGLQLRVDGELMKIEAPGIALASGGRIIPTTAPGGIQIETPGGTAFVITPGWWEHNQLWYMNIDTRHVRATQGLMGTIAPGNWLPALPDGSLMGPRPESLQQRHQDLYKRFGNAWRVSDQTSLFDYAPETSTKTFTIEQWPGGDSAGGCKLPQAAESTPPKSAPKPLALEVAQQMCSGIVDADRRANCIQDVMVTGEPSFARTYLLAEQIRRNQAPTPPILVAPESNSTKLVPPVTFTWNKSTDLDGQPLTYKLYVWPAGKQPNNNEAEPVPTTESQLNSPTLSKTVDNLEPGKPYFWKVIAEDGKGGSVESKTRRFEMK